LPTDENGRPKESGENKAEEMDPADVALMEKIEKAMVPIYMKLNLIVSSLDTLSRRVAAVESSVASLTKQSN